MFPRLQPMLRQMFHHWCKSSSCLNTHTHHPSQPTACTHFRVHRTNEIISPSTAFFMYNMGIPVTYKRIILQDLIQHKHGNTQDGKIELIQVLLGYDIRRDVFIFLDYIQDKDAVDPTERCLLCLESLSLPRPDDFAICVKGIRCFHHLHWSCYNRLQDRGLSPAPCCKNQQHRLLAYVNPLQISDARAIVNGTSVEWIDKMSVKVPDAQSKSHHHLLAFVKQVYNNDFIHFPSELFVTESASTDGQRCSNKVVPL
jgi:hypothetical protein